MSCYAFRDNKDGKRPQDWLPLPWESDDDDREPPISEQERQELTDLIDAENARLQTETQQ